MESLPNEERGLFLAFAWGRRRMPSQVRGLKREGAGGSGGAGGRRGEGGEARRGRASETMTEGHQGLSRRTIPAFLEAALRAFLTLGRKGLCLVL